jgi:hypothetical protein
MSDNLRFVVYKMPLEKFSLSISAAPANFHFTDCSIPMHHLGADTIGPLVAGIQNGLTSQPSLPKKETYTYMHFGGPSAMQGDDNSLTQNSTAYFILV